ncbi:hypothetical protein NC796_04835 [Aliifodinibius sp. S!AR15-10]|uniref:hypothetical protein n=1 Tax=Aliifodinibius sp. S!AR15-10 TaxID=2950437 RepID=UPI002865925A|nr:hypothetical protein [Aliifodinibius sp. S!AR15-10]MDR8390456.1 hypothetical protein [Aliifodinibius sp. S!AR15-10]
MTIVKQIGYYLKEELTKQEAQDLWVHLLQHPADLQLLEKGLIMQDYTKMNNIDSMLQLSRPIL